MAFCSMRKTHKKTGWNFLTYITALLLCLPLLTIFAVNVQAKDNCAGISDNGDRLECYEKLEADTRAKLDSTRSKISATQSTLAQLAGQLSVTQKELDDVQKNINEILAEIKTIETNLQDRQEKLADKINLRNKIIRSYSKKTSLSDLNVWLSGGFSSEAFMLAFNKAANTETLKIIGLLNSEIKGFEKDKAENESIKADLQKTQTQLASLRNDLANKKGSAENQVNQLEEQSSEYEKTLEGLQDKILSLKSSDENGSVGDSEYSSASTPNPKFQGTAFAAFSYGAYTHYNGMSQYGAQGRAKEGQGYEDILQFYYKSGTQKISGLDSKTISVQGYKSIKFRDYLYGIAEMPSDWEDAALRAQAVAARTYAYRYTSGLKNSICTSQSCQVFNKDKMNKVLNGQYSKWKDAVDDTENRILEKDVSSQYSSTTGGYINNIGWDVKGENSKNWPNDAYEKLARSPWFYKAWFTKSYNDSNSCGHPYPWLTAEEMADILNAYVVWTKGSSKDKIRISSLPKSCWGGDPYSMSELRDKAAKYAASYSKVTSVDSPKRTNGTVTSITFHTDKGDLSVDGQIFKTVFNTRSPAYVSIKSRLFNIEKKN